jgi:hypothetical protein
MSNEFIIGTITTLVIGFAGFIISYRTSKNPKLKYYQVEPGSIFSKNIKDISNIKILYNNNEITDEVILIKILISNDGLTDIDKNIVFEPLSILFKDPIELLEISAEDCPGNISIKQDGNAIFCEWDLLKRKEYFVIKAILKYNKIKTKEIDSNALLSEYTDVKCRITNLSKVHKESYTKSISKKPSKFNLFSSIFMFLFILGTFVFLLINKEYNICYKGNLLNSNYYTMTAKNKYNVELKTDKEKQIIDIIQYNQIEKITEVGLTEKNDIFIYFIFVYFLIFSFFSFVSVRRYFRHKKLISYFSKSKQTEEKK